MARSFGSSPTSVSVRSPARGCRSSSPRPAGARPPAPRPTPWRAGPARIPGLAEDLADRGEASPSGRAGGNVEGGIDVQGPPAPPRSSRVGDRPPSRRTVVVTGFPRVWTTTGTSQLQRGPGCFCSITKEISEPPFTDSRRSLRRGLEPRCPRLLDVVGEEGRALRALNREGRDVADSPVASRRLVGLLRRSARRDPVRTVAKEVSPPCGAARAARTDHRGPRPQAA